ncbi:trehalase family glycosidase, partial [Pseudomonas oryzihabitans]
DKYVPPAGQNLRDHIDGLWPVLTRTTSSAGQYDSLLPLPKPYVVPGGRFREVYYWDSYFTMLGLAESGHWDKVQDMVDNFASLLDRYG